MPWHKKEMAIGVIIGILVASAFAAALLVPRSTSSSTSSSQQQTTGTLIASSSTQTQSACSEITQGKQYFVACGSTTYTNTSTSNTCTTTGLVPGTCAEIGPPCFNAPESCATTQAVAYYLAVSDAGTQLFLAMENTGNVPIGGYEVMIDNQFAGTLNQTSTPHQIVSGTIQVASGITVVVGNTYAVNVIPMVHSGISFGDLINMTAIDASETPSA